MEKIVLNAELRGVGRHAVRELRREERVPAVVYGADVQAQAISVNARELQKALHQVGTGLMTLQIAGQGPMQVLPREVQRHPVRHTFLHVDFQAVSMTEKLRVHVPIVHEGEAPAIRANSDLVLVRNLDSVEVECLPGDIPNHLVADLTKLKDADDELFVRDLIVPAGVKVLTAADHVIFSLTLSRAGVLEEAAAEAPSAEVEVVAKGK
ncbi:MAG: 50S ribosomal protein L25, partial [Anaerolineae bacterium]